DDKLPWSTVRSVGRNDARQVPPEALKAIFRSDANKLPAYVGSPSSGGGYTLYKLIKVSHSETTDDQRRQAMRREHAALLGQEEFHAYLAGLRTRYKIDINKAVLESKDR
ncbi:MAG: peptidylprolyl isomerase, partial [Candidatus Accumulibacter sp.]|nr:peptidylprolyl isomerase [Accumulibacter sp.]